MADTPVVTDEALTGRSAELGVLSDLLRQTRSRGAQVVVVEGPAGIGKTALLSAFVRRNVDVRHVIWLRCEELERNETYGAAMALLGDRAIVELSELEVGRRLLARLGDETGRPGRSTVLAIDDAQWMDGPSARALRFALGRLGVEPFLAIVARRSHAAPVEFTSRPPHPTALLRLGPLDPDAVRELARQVRGWEISTTTADRLVQQTGGLPLLVAGVLRNSSDHDGLEHWADVPASAASSAARMLEPLDGPARRVVEAVAVLAEPADLVTLAAVAEVEHPATAADDAVRAGLLVVDRQGAFTAAHVLLREAVYESLPLSRRRETHARAARWTTGERSLTHRAASLDRSDPMLVTDLVAAAARARAARRYDLAATLRLRARSVSDDASQRADLLVEALIDRVAAQDLDGAAALMGPASDLEPSARQGLALGLLCRERGEVGAAQSWLQAALARSEATDTDVRPRAAVGIATLYVRVNDGVRAVQALAEAGPITDPELACDAVTTRGIGLWQQGDSRAALDALRAAPLSRDGTPWEAELIAARGMIQLFDGDLIEARGNLDRAVELAHLWRPSTNQSRIFVLRCIVRGHLGDWDGAFGDAAAARALAESVAQVWSIAWARAVSVELPAHRGLWDIAEQHLAAARTALAEFPNVHLLDTVGRSEAALAVARGDHERALRALTPLRTDEHLQQVAGFGSHRVILPAWITSCLELGRTAEAAAELRRYEQAVRRWSSGVVPARLGWLRGQLARAQGDASGARQHLRDQLADPSLSRTPFLHAQVAQTAGRLEHAAGRRRQARDLLTTAAEAYARLQATPYLESARADLAASGLRSPSDNPRGLTEREEDVAALVARGYTNNEVARELFISTKAVEAHLNRIYVKLGIKRRQELRRVHSPDRP